MHGSFGWWRQRYFKSQRRKMADRRMFSYHENGFFSETCLSTGWKSYKGTFPDMFSLTDNLSFSWKKLDSKYTCEELLDTLKAMNFVEVQEQGFVPTYKRESITDALHVACGFRTDYQFITKSKMKTIQKESKGR